MNRLPKSVRPGLSDVSLRPVDGDYQANPWRTLESREVYENPWILVREDTVVRPDGNPGIYGVVHFKNRAIAIVPVDDEGYIHLVGQYRYPLGCYSWELPEGGCSHDEEPLEAAKRELLEETGLVAEEWLLLGTAHLSNSVSDEEAFCYLATRLVQHDARPEATEKLEHRRVAVEEAVRMVEEGEITDALSIIGILRYLRLQ